MAANPTRSMRQKPQLLPEGLDLDEIRINPSLLERKK
jgi:hypothetical protein